MLDLLKEKWVQDGIAAVFSETIKTYEGYNTEICDLDDLDTGCWETDDVDMDDIASMANLIAHAPDMYRMLHSIATSKTASLNDINALLAEIG